MTPRHDGGPDTGPQVVAALLFMDAPELAGLPLQLLSTTGSDNTLYRLGSGLVVRLPRLADAAARLDVELEWLARLTELPVAVPEVVHVGRPGGSYPYRWAVIRWLVGVDAWHVRHHKDWFGPDLAHDLTAVIGQLRAMPVCGAPHREPGQRGGPLEALDARLRWWLERADGLLDVRAVLLLWDECREAAADDVPPALVHGDLIPGNLLIADGRLTAVLDWGTLGAADPAQDLTPAWAVLDAAGAAAFREALEVDAPSWSRGRGFALEQAVGGIVTYLPRRHPLGAVMQRTLDRLLTCG